MLSLRDPIASTNDLGRKGICIKHLQETCKALHRVMRMNLEENNKSSLLFSIVGHVFGLNSHWRKRLHGYGYRLCHNRENTVTLKKFTRTPEGDLTSADVAAEEAGLAPGETEAELEEGQIKIKMSIADEADTLVRKSTDLSTS